MSFIVDYLKENWNDLFSGKKPGKVQIAKASSRPHCKSSISFLVFIDEESEPRYIVKLNRDPDFADAVVSEYNNLHSIVTLLQDTRDSVPEPLFLKEVNGYTMLCQRALKGKKLGYELFSRRNTKGKAKIVDNFLSNSFRWLSRFHLETNAGYRELDEEFLETEVALPARMFLEQFKDNNNGYFKSRLDNMARGLRSNMGAKVPVSSIHGDFTYRNILLYGSDIRVIDWEDCDKSAVPFQDIFFFIAQLGLNFYPELEPTESFKAFFKKGTWTRQILDRSLKQYSETTALERKIIVDMFPFFILKLLAIPCEPHRNPESYLFRSPEMLKAVLDINLSKTEGAQ